MSDDNVRILPNPSVPSGLIELAKPAINESVDAYLALIDSEGRITEYTTDMSVADAALIATAAQRHALIRMDVEQDNFEEEPNP